MPLRPAIILGILILTTGALASCDRKENIKVATRSWDQPYCAPTVAHGLARQPSPQSRAGGGCLIDTGMNDVSPSIQVSRTGVLFIARSSGGVLRSQDDGRHWEKLTPPALANGDSHAKGGHGYVHIDRVTDRIYYLTSMSAASCGRFNAGSVLSWSDDLGKTWGGSTVGCGTYDWGRVVTGAGPGGTRAIYYLGVAPRIVGGQRLVFRSLDNGKTWGQTKETASATTESGAGVTAPDGTIYFDYPEFIGFDISRRLFDKTHPFKPSDLCHEMIAVSEDFGDTWRQEPIPHSRACGSFYGQQQVAVDAAGSVYAVWTDDRDSQIYMVVSHDKAHTWSKPVNIMPPGATFSNSYTNIIAGERGHVVISSMNTQDIVNPRKFFMQGAGKWHSYMTESFDAASGSPQFRSVDLDPQDDPSLVDGEAPNEANVYMGMSPAGKTWAVFSRHGAGFLGTTSRIFAGNIGDK